MKCAAPSSEMENSCTQAFKIVGCFKSSNTAKEKQTHMGLPLLKLMQEVDTRWNSMSLHIFVHKNCLVLVSGSILKQQDPFFNQTRGHD